MNNFEMLSGLQQLPGLAIQRLMEKDHGFGGEGDWKTAAMVRLMKIMAGGKELTNLFQYNIPQRWSIAHLYLHRYQSTKYLAVVDKELLFMVIFFQDNYVILKGGIVFQEILNKRMRKL